MTWPPRARPRLVGSSPVPVGASRRLTGTAVSPVGSVEASARFRQASEERAPARDLRGMADISRLDDHGWSVRRSSQLRAARRQREEPCAPVVVRTALDQVAALSIRRHNLVTLLLSIPRACPARAGSRVGLSAPFEKDHERVGMGHRHGMAAGCLIAREKPGGPYERLNQASEVGPFDVRGRVGSLLRVGGRGVTAVIVAGDSCARNHFRGAPGPRDLEGRR